MRSLVVSVRVIIALNWLVAWATFRYQRLPRMLEHVFTVLVRHGRVLHGTLDREHMSMARRRAVLSTEGMATLSEVRYAILAEDGSIAVIPRSVRPA